MNRAAFFNAIRPMFGGTLTTAQVQGLEILLTATEGLPVSHRAYLLATAKHETAHTMQPVRETLAKSDAGAVKALDRAFAAGKLPWVKSPYWRPDADGKSWFGRGYVQLTHKANYQRAGKAMGIDLVADPSAALSPMLAARILVQGCGEGWFTGKRLSDYLPGDYAGARRVVNGTDRAKEIAGMAEAFEAALVAAMPPAPDHAPEPPKPAAVWWLRAVQGVLDALFAKWRT